MVAETDLKRLLSSMKPSLAPETYVFCVAPTVNWPDIEALNPVMTFREREGLTLVLVEQVAVDANLEMSSPMRMISLTVHSDLEAVGLTAAFASALGAQGVSANVAAAFHHDHIFVPAHQAHTAMQALLTLQQDASAAGASD